MKPTSWWASAGRAGEVKAELKDKGAIGFQLVPTYRLKLADKGALGFRLPDPPAPDWQIFGSDSASQKLFPNYRPFSVSDKGVLGFKIPEPPGPDWRIFGGEAVTVEAIPRITAASAADKGSLGFDIVVPPVADLKFLGSEAVELGVKPRITNFPVWDKGLVLFELIVEPVDGNLSFSGNNEIVVNTISRIAPGPSPSARGKLGLASIIPPDPDSTFSISGSDVPSVNTEDRRECGIELQIPNRDAVAGQKFTIKVRPKTSCAGWPRYRCRYGNDFNGYCMSIYPFRTPFDVPPLWNMVGDVDNDGWQSFSWIPPSVSTRTKYSHIVRFEWLKSDSGEFDTSISTRSFDVYVKPDVACILNLAITAEVTSGEQASGSVATGQGCAQSVPGENPWTLTGTTNDWLKVGSDGTLSGEAPDVQSRTTENFIITYQPTGSSANTISGSIVINPPSVPCVITGTPGTTVTGNQRYQAQLGVSGCPTGGTWSITGPSWISIDQNGLVDGNAPNVSGSHSIVATYTAGAVTRDKSWTLRVNAVICALSSTTQSSIQEGATLGSNNTVSLGSGCPVGGTWTVENSLNNWIRFVQVDDTGGIRLTGTAPQVTSTLTDNFTVRYRVSDSESYTLNIDITIRNVSVPTPCTVSISGPSEVNEGVQYRATSALSGNCAQPATDTAWEITGPVWLGIDDSGVVEGTLQIGSIDRDTTISYTVTYTDDDGDTYSESESFIVRSVPDPVPCSVSLTLPSIVDENESVDGSASTSGDCDSETWSLSVREILSSVRFGPEETWLGIDSSGVISGTAPDLTSSRNKSYRVVASYGDDSDSSTIIVRYVPPPQPCVVTISLPANVNENEAIGAASASSTGECGSSASWSLSVKEARTPTDFGPEESWLSINPLTGLITGTAPDITDASNKNYRVEASYGSSSAAAYITVRYVPPPPPGCSVAVTGPSTVNEGNQYLANVILSDCASGGSWSLSGPSWLDVYTDGVFLADAEVRGTAPQVNSDTPFTYEVKYTEPDGTETTADGSGTITNTPDPCVVSFDLPSEVNEGDQVSVQASKSGACSGSWSLSGASWLQISSNGRITGRADYVNQDTDYTVVVSYGSDSASDTITVKNVPPCVVSLTLPRNVNENEAVGSASASKSGTCSASSWSLSVRENQSPGVLGPEETWLSIDSSSGNITGTAPDITDGAHKNYRVEASYAGASDVSYITVRYVPPPPPPPQVCEVSITSDSSEVFAGQTWTGQAETENCGTFTSTGIDSSPWAVSGGASISSLGVITLAVPDNKPGGSVYNIVATYTDDDGNSTDSDPFIITVRAKCAVTISGRTSGSVGYSWEATASSNCGSGTWTVVRKASWMSWNASTRKVSGVPNAKGRFYFEVRFTPTSGNVSTGTISVLVTSALSIKAPDFSLAPGETETRYILQVGGVTPYVITLESVPDDPLISVSLEEDRPGEVLSLAQVKVTIGPGHAGGTYSYRLKVVDGNGNAAYDDGGIAISGGPI